MQNQALLKVENLTHFFGGLAALNDVSFQVRPNEIVSIIGPNGAGKTTILNIISGFLQASRGQIYFDDVKISGLKPYEIIKRGIARGFQITRLFKNLTVLENIMIGMHTQFNCSLFDEVLETKRKKEVENDFLKRAKALTFNFGIKHFDNEKAGNLPFGTQRKIEITRAYASSPKLLLLDEPGSGMNLKEVDDLMQILRRINANNVTLIIIEHNMDIVMDISQRIIVLNHGIKIAEGSPQEIQNNSDVIEAYLGKKE